MPHKISYLNHLAGKVIGIGLYELTSVHNTYTEANSRNDNECCYRENA